MTLLGYTKTLTDFAIGHKTAEADHPVKSDPGPLEPYGTSEGRKKVRWLLSTPPQNNALKMEITPAIAYAMMERNKDDEWHNRPESPKAIRRYIAAMSRGWKYTGEPIIFSASGRLLNGQHRLRACIAANTSFPCLVVFGIDDDAFAFMDIGTTRTAGHIFAIESIPNYNWAAATIRLVYFYLKNQAWDGHVGDIENDVLVDFYRHHEGIQDSYHASNLLYKEGLLPPRWGGFIHYVCGLKNKQQADEFFDRLASGIGLTNKNDPIYLIRKRLLENQRATAPNKVADVYLSAYTLQAWNSFRSGRHAKIFRWRGAQNAHESFPRAQ